MSAMRIYNRNSSRPDRIPIFLMGAPPYSDVYIEIMKNNQAILDQWTENDENIVITPLGDYTIRYNLGAEVETYGVGIITDFTSKYIDKDGNILGDFNPAKKQELLNLLRKKQKEDPNSGLGIEYRTISYEGRITGTTILQMGMNIPGL
jgi:hypothetical protein